MSPSQEPRDERVELEIVKPGQASPAAHVAADHALAESLELAECISVAESPRRAAEAEEEPKLPMRLLTLLCMVGGLEGADAVLLPCVLYALERDLGLTLNDLALMSMVQALAGNITAPLWGVLADRGTLKRKTIIVTGCVVQGLITAVLSGVDSMTPMLLLRAFNGAMLSSLRPIANGIIADVTVETNRGKVYGLMGIAMNVGTMSGSVVGTNLGRKTVGGLQGWRVSFLIIGFASVFVGLLAAVLMREPPRPRGRGGSRAEGRGWAAFTAEIKELGTYFRMASFRVLILQGMFGMVPWNALGYKTLFFQLGGITDFQASVIDVLSHISGSLGTLLGGVVGDALSRCSRYHGRPITAQVSVLAGIPVAWCIFMQAPPIGEAFPYYLLLMITLGLTSTWCYAGVNLPVLSEIVKGDRRASIMAWEGALESSCSAIFGNAMVGILAEDVFGYDLSSVAGDGGKDPSKMKALGSALMLTSLFPWVLCFCCYSLLHWSYKKDLTWLGQEEGKAGEARASEAADGKAQEGPGREAGSPSRKEQVLGKSTPERLGISAAAQAMAQSEPNQH